MGLTSLPLPDDRVPFLIQVFFAVELEGDQVLTLLENQRNQFQPQWWDGLRLTFVLETLALISFGLSWLIKGRFINRFEDETVATQLASEA